MTCDWHGCGLCSLNDQDYFEIHFLAIRFLISDDREVYTASGLDFNSKDGLIPQRIGSGRFGIAFRRLGLFSAERCMIPRRCHLVLGRRAEQVFVTQNWSLM